MWKTILLSTKDLFSAMPVIVSVTIFLQMVTAGISVAMVSLTAKLIDSAGNISSDAKAVFVFAGVILCCRLVSLFCEKISYRINQIDAVPKFEIFHHRLSQYTVSLSLEAAEDPEISGMFWRAKDAVYQNRMGEVFFGVFGILPGLFQLVSIAIVLGAYHKVLVLLAGISVLPVLIVQIMQGKKGYRLYKSQTEKNRLCGYLWELLTSRNSVKEMRIMGFSGYLTDKYLEVQEEVNEENRRFAMKSSLQGFLCDFIKIAFYAVSIAVCVMLLRESKISVGAFGACLGAFTSMQGVLAGLLSGISGIKNTCNYANDYYDFFHLKKADTHTRKVNLSGSVLSTEDLSFRYPKADQNAVNRVNLAIKKGEIIAIVGENGSGKTTLSKLLLGLYTPTEGYVRMDGEDIQTLNHDYYKKFSLVAQRFGRYSISLRDNIAISDIRRREDTFLIQSAMDTAGIKNLGAQIGGINEELGIEFGGKELSGGQWQKVALARGVFRKGEILFLDEPTSALDPITEYDILSGFVGMVDQKTAFVVSHRIGICKIVDRILVMQNGKIVEDGTHEQLLRRSGVYAKMWDEQAKWYQE